ncbi:hypothetical protein SAMN05518672_108100 [Chitinophaga sp. CF118]|uniref:hypothetical protein n=1 Tax=Chitinophaga sp. CF118 TaxID=1884367 RepID=UPI0008F1F5EF|nr:hypothetical protein [Chitinophaga sp. CF118]SFE61238.1 hypothetical protein SAMN05518672_108100 [Chitinophaga sp. CF118]
MISLTRSIFIALLVVFSSTAVFAKARIPLGEREVLNKVLDLPDTDEFKLKDGNFFDLATLHKEFNIAYLLPLYITEEPKLVGFDEQTETYYDIPQNEIDAILASQKRNKEELNKLPFYTRYGGKIVALLIIGLLIWGVIPSKKEKVTPENI